MKTKSLRIGKRSLAMVLSLMMIVSSVFVGSLNGSAVTVDVENSEAKLNVESSGGSTSITSNGNDIIMYANVKAVPSTVTWENDSAKTGAYFFNSSNDQNAWAPLATKVDTTDGKLVYAFTVPSGTWDRLILVRLSPDVGNTPSWGNNNAYAWNQTENIILNSDCNYLSTVGNSKNSGESKIYGYQWGTYIRNDVTVSLGANPTTVDVGEAVTLSASINSNANLFSSSTLFKVVDANNNDSTVDPSNYDRNGNQIIFNEAGKYKVIDYITYYAKGFPNIADVTTATSTEITVDSVDPKSGIKVYSSIDGTNTNLISGVSATYGDTTITPGDNTLSNVSGSILLSAPSTVSIEDNSVLKNYQFVNWTASNGTLGNDSSTNTTFHPSKDNAYATANYKQYYTVKLSATNGSATINGSSNIKADVGGTYTVDLVPNSRYTLSSLKINGSPVNISNISDSYSLTVSSDNTTVEAVFTEIEETVFVEGRFAYDDGTGNLIYTSGGDYGYVSDCTDIAMTHVEGTVYKLETNLNLQQLRSNLVASYGKGDGWKRNGNSQRPYFYFAKVSKAKSEVISTDINSATKYYPVNGNTYGNLVLTSDTSYNGPYSVQSSTPKNFTFEGSNSKVQGSVTLWLNTRTAKFWYTIETDTIHVVAKDGTIRTETKTSTGINYEDSGSNIYQKFPQIADTHITGAGFTAKDAYKRGGNFEAEEADVEKGTTITITTTINEESAIGYLKSNGYSENYTNKDVYYVKGYVINGETYPVADTVSSDGKYSITYTIPTNPNKESDKYRQIEITPVYFYNKDIIGADNIIKFYVENFDEAEEDWGDTVACYAYYIKTQSDDLSDDTRPTLGGFPGQPMLYENGRYYIEIPKSMMVGTNERTITGMTINNYIWDHVHGNMNGANNDVQADRQNANHQTYDYDDFVTLAERPKVDTIYFRFKYRTSENQPTESNNTNAQYYRNYGNLPQNYKTSGIAGLFDTNFKNGWEIRRNHENVAVDLFGNEIDEPDESAAFYRVVSDGYIDNYIGYFATEWSVFDPDGNYIGTMPQSAFYYKPTDNDFLDDKVTLKTTVPSGFKGGSAYWGQYKKIYESGVLNQPAKITFETAVYSSGYPVTGSDVGSPNDPAERCDGLWFVSDTYVYADIKIEYQNIGDPATTWNNDDFIPGTNTGKTTGASAYLTNTGNDAINQYKKSFTNLTSSDRVTPDSSKTFDFAATSIGSSTDDSKIYKFEGWYILFEDKYIPISSTEADNLNKSSEIRDKSYILVARYKQVENEDLIISHELLSKSPDDEVKDKNNKIIEKGSGNGTTTAKVEIYKRVADPNTGETTLNYIETLAEETTDLITLSNVDVLTDYSDKDDNYVMKITLTTTPASASDKFEALYDRVVDGENVVYYNSADDETPIISSAVKSVNNSKNITTNTYEFDVADLYDGGNLKTHALKYYSKITSDESLTISHDLLKNSNDGVINVSNSDGSVEDDTADTTTTTEKGSGTGITKVYVTILDSNDTEISEQSYETPSDKVSIDKDTLKSYADNGYKLKITVTTTPTDNSTFDSLYDRELSDFSNSSSTPIYYEASANKQNAYSNFGKSNGKPVTENGTTTTTYTIDAKDFFVATENEDGTTEISNDLKTKSVQYFSKLNASQTLTISHNLLTNAPDTTVTGTTGTIEKGAGTGTTTVTAEIWNGGSKVGDATITTNEDGTVSIESSELKKYPNGTLKINLETKPASNSSFDSLYDRELSDLTDDTSVTYYGTNETDSNKAKICGNASSQPTPGENGATITTYEVPINKLFDGNSLKTTALKFFSKLSQSIIINFKYYDRNIVNYSQPATIDTEATTVRISQTLDKNIETTISNALENPVDEDGKRIKMSEIGNVIDDYYFWTSQDQATGDSGIKALENYHIAPTVSGNEVTYTTYGDSSYSNLDYHLDCYGKPLTDNRTEADRWVSYITTDDEQPKAYLNGDESGFDLTKVTEVTVWGYNAPKIYYVDLLKPASDTAELVKSSDSENVQYKGFGDDVYIAKGNSSTPVGAFYNQRLGGYDKSSIDKYTNAASAYLNEYGIGVENGTGNAYVNTDNDAVTAVSEIKDNTGKTKYVFDGWYDVETKQKISSDLVYGYRVTKTLSIVAGYKETDKKSTEVGVTVTSNGIDHYIDDNDPDQIQRVRLNTQVNVYNAYSEKGDENIKNIAAIYVKVNNEQDYGAVREVIEEHLRDDDGWLTVGTPKQERLDTGNQIIYYTYTVVFGNWSDIDKDENAANRAQLTNKNRIQFTLPMNEEAFNKPILSFSAIYYNGESPADAEANKNLDEGSTRKSTTGWILSENYVEFIPESEP